MAKKTTPKSAKDETTRRGAAPSSAQLAKLDREIVDLLNQRASLVQQRRESRDEQPPDMTDLAVLDAAAKASHGPLPSAAVSAVFRELLSGIRATSGPVRVAYLGPEYTYSHLAAIARFGQSAELMPVSTIAAVFEEVERGHAAYGVVPIENSTDGRVADALECFSRSGNLTAAGGGDISARLKTPNSSFQPSAALQICGEVPLRIRHCLLGHGKRADIRRVCSKPQALSQCRNWLSTHLPGAKLEPTASSAEAACLAAAEPETAAIASEQAAVNHGLDVLARNIEDNSDNVTRFAIIGRTASVRTGNDKTALVFEAPHEPGALADAMAIFKRQRLNLTWIESFPIPQARGPLSLLPRVPRPPKRAARPPRRRLAGKEIAPSGGFGLLCRSRCGGIALANLRTPAPPLCGPVLTPLAIAPRRTSNLLPPARINRSHRNATPRQCTLGFRRALRSCAPAQAPEGSTVPVLKILWIAAALSWSMAASSWCAPFDAPVLAPPSNLDLSPSPTESAEPAPARDGGLVPRELLFLPPELPNVVNNIAGTDGFSGAQAPEFQLLPSITSEMIAVEAPCLTAACTPVSRYMSCCDPLRCHSFWFAGIDAGVLGIKARTGGRASIRFDDSTLPGTEFQAVGGTGLENVVVAPRVALGYQVNPSWGVVGRYWYVSDNDQNIPAVPPETASLDGFFVAESAHVRLDAADLELIRSAAPGLWKLDASVGARHASLDESAEISAGADFAGPSFARAYLLNRTRFSGTGLTGALAARRPLGVAGASLFASGRSSFLWGTASSRAQLVTLLSTPNGSPATELIIDRAASPPVAWIGEIQLGVQWDLPLERFPANAFFRTAVEYQHWDVNASIDSQINANFTDPTISTSQSVSAGDGSVELYGLVLATGFTW